MKDYHDSNANYIYIYIYILVFGQYNSIFVCIVSMHNIQGSARSITDIVIGNKFGLPEFKSRMKMFAFYITLIPLAMI